MKLRAVMDTNVLVSGDRHLLNLLQYQSVRILTAREFYQKNIHKVT
jgi:predicted nucleic acid-binding protein